MSHTRDRSGKRWLAVPAVLVLTVLSVLVGPASSASAAGVTHCVDAVQNPNNNDWCYVSSTDYNREYIVDSVQGVEVDCNQTSLPRNSFKVRLVGDYESAGDKFHLRALGIRYLSGTKPWAYFQIQVTDGNGVAVNRDWNYNGNWIKYDGAGRDVDNTTNLTPPVSYSPVFGRNRSVTFLFFVRESDAPLFPYDRGCNGGHFYVQLKPR
jgi:hypothetical protein